MEKSNNNFNIQMFQDFIKNANNYLTCGPDCQKEKKKEELHKKYINAKSNLIEAPDELEKATQEYITFTQGEHGYEEYINNELEKKSKKIGLSLKNNFEEEIKKIQTEEKSFLVIHKNYKYLEELLLKKKQENKEFENLLKVKSSDIITNERKSFYENQQIDTYKKYYFIFISFYYLLVFIYCIIFLYYKNWSKIFIGVLLLFYPWVINHLMLNYSHNYV
jgi:hypothetical protein